MGAWAEHGPERTHKILRDGDEGRRGEDDVRTREEEVGAAFRRARREGEAEAVPLRGYCVVREEGLQYGGHGRPVVGALQAGQRRTGGRAAL